MPFYLRKWKRGQNREKTGKRNLKIKSYPTDVYIPKSGGSGYEQENISDIGRLFLSHAGTAIQSHG